MQRKKTFFFIGFSFLIVFLLSNIMAIDYTFKYGNTGYTSFYNTNSVDNPPLGTSPPPAYNVDSTTNTRLNVSGDTQYISITESTGEYNYLYLVADLTPYKGNSFTFNFSGTAGGNTEGSDTHRFWVFNYTAGAWQNCTSAKSWSVSTMKIESCIFGYNTDIYNATSNKTYFLVHSDTTGVTMNVDYISLRITSNSSVINVNYTSATPSNNTYQTNRSFFVGASGESVDRDTVILSINNSLYQYFLNLSEVTSTSMSWITLRTINVGGRVVNLTGNLRVYPTNSGTRTAYTRANYSYTDGTSTLTSTSSTTSGTNVSVAYENPNPTKEVSLIKLEGYISDNSLDNVQVAINNHNLTYIKTNYTMTCSGTPTYTCNLTTPNFTDGTYYYYVWINDTSGQTASTSQRKITIDNVFPQVSYNPSTQANGTWSTTGNVLINVTASDTNLQSVNISWAGTNESFQTSWGNNIYTTLKSLVTGTYTFYAWIKDYVGQYNTTALYTIFVDKEDPVVTILEPSYDDITFNYNTSILFNATHSDTNLGSCWYDFDNSTNNSITCNTGIYINATDGTHNLTAYANDSSGRIGSALRRFIVNMGAPTIIFYTPTTDAWINSSNVPFTFIPNNTLAFDTCQLYTNITGVWQVDNETKSVVNGAENDLSYPAPDGYYSYNIWCNDTNNNIVWALTTRNETFYVDTVFPQIDFNAGTQNNYANITGTSITVNITASDLNEKNITFYLFNSSNNLIKTDAYTDKTRNNTWTLLSDGIYYYNVTLIDKALNSNSTATRTIRLDNLPPTNTITSPQATNYTFNNSLNLNFSVSDSGVGVNSCWFNVINTGGTSFYNQQQITNCQNTSFSLPRGDGNYILSFFSNDTLNNVNSTNISFSLRMDAPVVTLANPISPSNYLNTLQNIRFSFVVVDNWEIADTCELWGNWTGTWHKNQTITNISESITSNFSLLNLTEGMFNWNIWCNDTFNNGAFSSSNETLITDITYPAVSIPTPTNGTSTSTSFSFDYNISDTNMYLCYFNIVNSSGVWEYSPNQSLTCGYYSRSTSVSADGAYDLYVWGEDRAGNINNSIVSLTLAGGGSSPPAGGGGGGSETIIEIESNRTYCGDGVCQVNGNDNGINEDYYSCSQDCKPFNIDTAIMGCFDEDIETACVWDQIRFKYVGLFIGLFGLVLAFSTTNMQGKQVPLYKYILLAGGKRKQ